MNGLHPELQQSFAVRLQNAMTFEQLLASRERVHYSERNWDFAHCTIDEVDVDGLRVIRLTPATVSDDAPCFIWMHGGGMVFGQPDDSIPFLVDFVYTFQATVLIPQYRLAPEHPYPAALHDGYKALQWAAQTMPHARIIMCGGSAGGNLALAISLYARDHGGPSIAGIIPIYPMLDAKPRPFHAQFTSPAFWNLDKNTKAWQAYLAETEGLPPYASPLYADLSNLPPMYTYVGTHDMFYEEVLQFINDVKEADGKITYHLYPGCVHGFDLEPIAIANVAKLRMLAAAAQFLTR